MSSERNIKGLFKFCPRNKLGCGKFKQSLKSQDDFLKLA